MSSNTFHQNQHRCRLSDNEQVWLFGYGSLIYLVDFPYLEARPASIRDWSRRFWQGSHDHRGTAQHPGRVVTLIEQSGAICGGMAYLVEAKVFKQLDHREKNGYLRVATEISFSDGQTATGLTYIANPDNAAYLGEAPEFEIARHISRARGPSGPPHEYLLELARALRDLGMHDDHVFTIESHLDAISRNGTPDSI